MTVFNVVKKLYNQPLDDKPDVAVTHELTPDCSLKRDAQIGDILSGSRHSHAVVLSRFDDGDKNPEGKICPETLQRMPAPVPCKFGSKVLFMDEPARDAASESYHKFEWKIDEWVKSAGLSPTARLALRMVFIEPPAVMNDDPEDASTVVLTGLLVELTRKVGFAGKTPEEMHKCVLIARRHAVKMSALDAPKPGQRHDQPPGAHTFAVGIYPDLGALVWTRGLGVANCFAFRKNDRLILQALRRIKSGDRLKAIPLEGSGDDDSETNPETNPDSGLNAADLITFRCSGDECQVGFPLKENTKEKLIKCPVCQKETNIWLKLKKIQVQRFSAVTGLLQ